MAELFVGQRAGFRILIAVRESIESVDSPRNILRLLLQITRITFVVALAIGLRTPQYKYPEEIAIG